MLPTTQIRRSGIAEFRAISEFADGLIAVRTEQSADFAGDVAVIDVQRKHDIVSRHSFWLSANGAEVVLCFKHLLVGLLSKPVFTHQHLSSDARPIVSMVASLSLFATAQLLLRRAIESCYEVICTGARAARSILQNAKLHLDMPVWADGLVDLGLGKSRIVPTFLPFAILLALFLSGISPLLTATLPTALSAHPVKSSNHVLVMSFGAEIGRVFHSINVTDCAPHYNTLVGNDAKEVEI